MSFKEGFLCTSESGLVLFCGCIHCRQLEEEAWKERDRVAHAKFKKEREREEAILREREEREVGSRVV